MASTRAWAESLHALDVYHTLDLADARSSGESRSGPRAAFPPSVFHPREPSVRCWRPSRSIQTTRQLLPSSPEASQCSRASRSDFQNLTPTGSGCSEEDQEETFNRFLKPAAPPDSGNGVVVPREAPDGPPKPKKKGKK